MNKATFKSRTEWRNWLLKNHDSERELWLVFFKKGSGIQAIDYNGAVEEALCFGWIDSIVRGIDGLKYMRKFTPRKDSSLWSASNRKRVEKLIREDRMTPSGMRKVEVAKRTGRWIPPDRPEIIFKPPAEFINALRENPIAKLNYEGLSQTHQKEYIGWIITAKREETRQRRIRESLTLLQEGKTLGLK